MRTVLVVLLVGVLSTAAWGQVINPGVPYSGGTSTSDSQTGINAVATAGGVATGQTPSMTASAIYVLGYDQALADVAFAGGADVVWFHASGGCTVLTASGALSRDLNAGLLVSNVLSGAAASDTVYLGPQSYTLSIGVTGTSGSWVIPAGVSVTGCGSTRTTVWGAIGGTDAPGAATIVFGNSSTLMNLTFSSSNFGSPGYTEAVLIVVSPSTGGPINISHCAIFSNGIDCGEFNVANVFLSSTSISSFYDCIVGGYLYLTDCAFGASNLSWVGAASEHCLHNVAGVVANRCTFTAVDLRSGSAGEVDGIFNGGTPLSVTNCSFNCGQLAGTSAANGVRSGQVVSYGCSYNCFSPSGTNTDLKITTSGTSTHDHSTTAGNVGGAPVVSGSVTVIYP